MRVCYVFYLVCLENVLCDPIPCSLTQLPILVAYELMWHQRKLGDQMTKSKLGNAPESVKNKLKGEISE